MSAEIKNLLRDAVFPIVIVLLLGLVKLIEFQYHYNFSMWGIVPRNSDRLIGILCAPFIHSDWKHLFNNSLPLLILGWALFHFYREVAFKVNVWVVLMGGFWTWISAREASHIGASGLLYGLFSFLLFSGFIRRNKQLLAISFLVAFLYGSLVWGILPFEYRMSWESHFWGFIAGLVMAINCRRIGRQREVHKWDEAEEARLDQSDYWKGDDGKVNFIYKEKDDKA